MMSHVELITPIVISNLKLQCLNQFFVIIVITKGTILLDNTAGDGNTANNGNKK